MRTEHSLVAGGAVSKVDPDSTGLNPAWRKAVCHVLCSESWPEGQPVPDILAARKRIQDNIKILDKVAPGSGAYFNEVRRFMSTLDASLITILHDPSGIFIRKRLQEHVLWFALPETQGHQRQVRSAGTFLGS